MPVTQPAVPEGRFGFQPAELETVKTSQSSKHAQVVSVSSSLRSQIATQSCSQKAPPEECQAGSDGSDLEPDSLPPVLSSNDPDLQREEEDEVGFPFHQLKDDDRMNESDLHAQADANIESDPDAGGGNRDGDEASMGLGDVDEGAVSDEPSDMECDDSRLAPQVNSTKVRVHIDDDKVNTRS
jgi:hypothetical protein